MKKRIRTLISVLMALAVIFTFSLSITPAVKAAAAASSADDEWGALHSMISQYYGEWKDTTYPGLLVDQIPQTALLGNGDLGVASGGDANEKNFYISKSDFWKYKGAPLPIGGVHLRPNNVTTDVWPDSLALGATATASSVNGSTDQSGPQRAVNGQWASGYEGWVSDLGNPQWLKIDMGASKTFDRIIIRHDQAARPEQTHTNTKAFTISISDTGNDGDWTQIYSVDNNTAPVSDILLKNAVTAQYIKLDVIQGTQADDGVDGDSTKNPRARIGQFEIYDTATQTFPSASTGSGITNFDEKENIADAQINTAMTWNGLPVTMNTWVAADSNCLVTELTSGDGDPINLQAVPWGKTGNTGYPVTVASTATTATVTRATATAGANSDPQYYRSVAAISTQIIGTPVTGNGSDAVTGTAWLNFTLKPDSTVYIVSAVGGGGRTYNYQNTLQGVLPTDQAAALLAAVPDAAAVGTMSAAHADWWKNYWLDSHIELSGSADLDTIMKYYYAAQYELGCECPQNPDGVAPGLYGVWHTTDSASWNGDYHLNYNFVATFYGVFSSNRSYQGAAATKAILDYLDNAKAAAASVPELKKVTSELKPAGSIDWVQNQINAGLIDAAKGIQNAILYPVGIGPYGAVTDTGYHNQIMDAGFSATLLINYYEATGDEDFLKNDLYNYLKLNTNLYQGWLQPNGDGTYTLFGGYNEGSWSKDPAGELAVCKNVLQHVIAYSEKLGLDADLRPTWEKILNGLAPAPTVTYTNGKQVYALAASEYTSAGQWVTPMASPVPGDGNMLSLESVTPTNQLGYYSAPDELTMAKDTIDVYSTRNAWTQINNFPKMYDIAVRTRYPSATVVGNLASTIRSQMKANMMIFDNNHGSEKAGATQAVNDMLMLSDQGVIKLFGNWQPTMNASFTRLRSGSFLISGSWSGADRAAASGSITSENGGSVTVASLWKDMIIKDDQGNTVAATLGSAPNHPDEPTYTFDTVEGKTYTFEKGPLALADVPLKDISFADSSLSLAIGHTATLDLIFDPMDYAGSRTVSWTSSNTQTATVDENGKVTALKVGNVTVTANVGDYQASIVIGVNPGMHGDVDNNDRIDTTDARMVLQFIVHKTDLDNAATYRADVNNDGDVNTVDARLILQYIVNKIDVFPADEP